MGADFSEEPTEATEDDSELPELESNEEENTESDQRMLNMEEEQTGEGSDQSADYLIAVPEWEVAEVMADMQQDEDGKYTDTPELDDIGTMFDETLASPSDDFSYVAPLLFVCFSLAAAMSLLVYKQVHRRKPQVAEPLLQSEC